MSEINAFWQEIRNELELVGRVMDTVAYLPNGGGNVPSGLYFFPDGTWASERAYYAFANDVFPRRLQWSAMDRRVPYFSPKAKEV